MTEGINVIQEVKNSGDVLNVTLEDLRFEMEVIFASKDVERMRELFLAYSGWEVEQVGRIMTLEEIKKTTYRSMDNLDLVSTIADNYHLTNGDLDSTIALLADTRYRVGPIRRFYRECVGYHPAAPTDGLN